VRACFERRFTARRMASEYLALYEGLRTSDKAPFVKHR
jgi:hypothetical protein